MGVFFQTSVQISLSCVAMRKGSGRSGGQEGLAGHTIGALEPWRRSAVDLEYRKANMSPLIMPDRHTDYF